jgi:DNA polymerase-3 subunit delta'
MIDVPVQLLTGRGGRRLEAEALDVAAALLCRTGDRTSACSDCRRVARREHPDLLVAAPESSRRANTPPFEESSGSKETTIPTALVRAIASDASRLPYEGARRAILLLDVDRTEPAAFSALLKVLEEPPSRARFVLTASRPRLLPPTILSRLVLRRLPSPSRAELVAALAAKGLSAEEAAARAAFCPTGPEEALDLDLDEARATRDALLEAVSGLLLSGSTGWALVLAGRLAAEDAAATAENFALLARLLRDAVAAGTDPAGKTVLHAERYRDLALLAKAGNDVLLDAASAALREAADLPDSRRNPRLAAEAFALSLRAG